MKLSRPPSVAGMFYSGSPAKLSEEVAYCLSLAENLLPETSIHGLTVPHAGYMYSGITAAYAYKTIAAHEYKTVVILSPSHTEYFHGCCIYKGDEYITPLGNIAINKTLRDALVKDSEYIFSGMNGHRNEHAVEVHLPFLLKVLPEFDFVPIVMGDQSPDNINALAESLETVLDPSILVIASSDLSHFYTQSKAISMDNRVRDFVQNYDLPGLSSGLADGSCEACGGGLIVAMMRALQNLPGRISHVLHQSDSSLSSGDTTEVVGYLSAAIHN